ncbi:MAG: hypothetical protein AAGM22_09210 [Acidobacteriota bacterium]
MKKTSRLLFTLTLSIATGLFAGPAMAEQPAAPTAFEQVFDHYEAVRLSLINDTTENVAQRGRKIQDVITGLIENGPAGGDASSEAAPEVRALLPELSEAAAALARATSLEGARDAFYAFSKPLVRWRKAVDGDRPIVAYCSMTRRSWLQPKGDAIGNPYHGQSMLRCGETVDG